MLFSVSSGSSSRPRLTRKGAATRARIVDAAAELIFQQGVARTTVEEVRDGAQVSSSQLYHYSKDKPALVHAVIERQAETMIATQERFDSAASMAYESGAISLSSTPATRTGSAVVRSARSVPSSPRRSPKPGQWLRRPSRRWEASIMAGFLRMQALGRLAPETDPRQLALATLAALQGDLLLGKVQRDSEPLAAALDAILTLIATLSSTTSTSLNR